MTFSLELDSLTKYFSKDKPAVRDLSFKVSKGEFKALLGVNGSGKSTTLKMCCNLLEPTSGKVLINGVDVRDDPSEALVHLGCVIETPSLYKDRTAEESLRYLCRLKGMTRESSTSESFRVLERVGMSPSFNIKFGKMSKGMKQRVVLAQALIGDPSILILDEPTSGLDPVGVNELESVLTGLNAEGMSILMSSHRLHEVERTCENYVFIRNGRKVSEGNVHEKEGQGGIVVLFSRPLSDEEVVRVKQIPGIGEINGVSATVASVDNESREAIMRALVLENLPVCGMESRGGLEAMFTEVGDSE
ncbi:MAG: ABC transporter ATP-binding protein [archaeon]|nr:ABC transporter ATP-binding protein [archaeon]